MWKANIEACGMSQREVADQVETLLTMMLQGKHTHGYTRGNVRGNAVGNWEWKGKTAGHEESDMAWKYETAMEMTDQATADAYFAECVRHCMSHGRTQAEAENIERSNLGYYAGYYSDATRERVERLFRCAHPIFGKIAEKGAPTAKAAFEAGKQFGQANCSGTISKPHKVHVWVSGHYCGAYEFATPEEADADYKYREGFHVLGCFYRRESPNDKLTDRKLT